MKKKNKLDKMETRLRGGVRAVIPSKPETEPEQKNENGETDADELLTMLHAQNATDGHEVEKPKSIKDGLKSGEIRRTMILDETTMMRLDYIIELEGYKTKTLVSKILRDWVSEYQEQHPNAEPDQQYIDYWKKKHKLL